jgi:alanyl-tRNA synthetase
MERHSVESGKLSETVMGSFGPIDELKSEFKSTEFVGYEATQSTAKILAIVHADRRVNSLSAAAAADSGDDRSTIVVLDRSPFYGEAGGQVGDSGELIGPHGRFAVRDTQRDSDLILHYGQVVEGQIAPGEPVTAEVDRRRREGIRRAHSATHVLHYALRKHLGTHAQQRGSKVDDDWLRFDFTHLEATSPAQIQTIEREALDKVHERAEVTAEVLPLAEARRRGAMMLFGEKYPEPVRMISMGEFSRELCGGTHLTNTADIREFEILSEEGVSAGTRRIVALTGDRAANFAAAVRSAVEQSAAALRCAPAELPDAVARLMAKIKGLRKQASGGGASTSPTAPPAKTSSKPISTHAEYREVLKQSARALNAALLDVPVRIEALLDEERSLLQQIDTAKAEPTVGLDELLRSAVQIGNARLVVAELPGTNANSLRTLIDQVRRQDRIAVFLASIAGAEKIQLVAGLSRDLVESGLSAGEWVKQVAPVVGGGGGGKPDFAQAGGKHPERIKQALQAATDYMRAALAT